MATFHAVIRGLEILAAHEPKGRESHAISADHDEIFAGNVPPEWLGAAEREELEKLGWRWLPRLESWARGV